MAGHRPRTPQRHREGRHSGGTTADRGEHLPLSNDERTVETGQVGEFVSLETIEEAHLCRVVEASDTLKDAAQVLGIDPATLYRKRRKYGLTESDDI